MNRLLDHVSFSIGDSNLRKRVMPSRGEKWDQLGVAIKLVRTESPPGACPSGINGYRRKSSTSSLSRRLALPPLEISTSSTSIQFKRAINFQHTVFLVLGVQCPASAPRKDYPAGTIITNWNYLVKAAESETRVVQPEGQVIPILNISFVSSRIYLLYGKGIFGSPGPKGSPSFTSYRKSRNRKSHYRNISRRHLLYSAGDVERNPGPYAKDALKCSECGDSVTRPHNFTCENHTCEAVCHKQTKCSFINRGKTIKKW